MRQVKISDDVIEEALRLEAQFAANKHSGVAQNPQVMEILGRRPLLLSCPHAVNHPRDRRLKLADTFTGALGLQLAASTDASIIVYARTSAEDPNYDADGPYKRSILSFIARAKPSIVIDLHGMGRSQPSDIAIGTSQGKTLGHCLELRDSLINILKSGGITNLAVDVPGFFDASRSNTIASFVWRTKSVPAIQVEIHKNFRDPAVMPSKYLQIFDLFKKFIELAAPVSHRL